LVELSALKGKKRQVQEEPLGALPDAVAEEVLKVRFFGGLVAAPAMLSSEILVAVVAKHGLDAQFEHGTVLGLDAQLELAANVSGKVELVAQ
jgi:hypothetical protein